jgi:hypothetical protein
MTYWNARTCKPNMRCRGQAPCIRPWSTLPPAPEASMGDYAQVTRGKHLFGGVYETLVDGEPIGVVKQGRHNPWWLPGVELPPQGMSGWAGTGIGIFVGLVGALMLMTVAQEMVPRFARRLGEELGINWATSDFGVAQFQAGIEVEKEHGPGGPAGRAGDVTHGDLLPTAKIALAHLREAPDYYVRLAALEAAAECE